VQHTPSLAYSRGVREGALERKERAARIARLLARAYPDAKIALRFGNAYELLVATILSAQCTDERVNQVTRELFHRFPAPAALAAARPADVEALVRPTGFFRQKARAIQEASRDVAERFGGEVPASLDELVSLRGVARKTANVVLGHAFGVPGLAVDTHVRRVSQRLELTREEDPVKIERDLATLLPPREWTAYTTRVIHHGRVCCTARSPRCDGCPLRPECPFPARAGARPAARRPARPGGARAVSRPAAARSRAR
jgi:endonuclease-3